MVWWALEDSVHQHLAGAAEDPGVAWHTADNAVQAQRALRTSADLPTEKQQDRLGALFTVDAHV